MGWGEGTPRKKSRRNDRGSTLFFGMKVCTLTLSVSTTQTHFFSLSFSHSFWSLRGVTTRLISYMDSHFPRFFFSSLSSWSTTLPAIPSLRLCERKETKCRKSKFRAPLGIKPLLLPLHFFPHFKKCHSILVKLALA